MDENQNPIDDLANEIEEKAKSKAKKKAKRALKAVGKKLKKATIMALKKLLIALAPYIGVVLVVLLLIFAVFFIKFEIKGATQGYTQETGYQNKTELKEDEKRNITFNQTSSNEDYSRENQAIQLFYKYYSSRSFYKTLDGKKLLTLDDDEEEFNKLQDDGHKEEMFYLSNDFLYALDEFLNNGAFIYPEQFVQPVYYDKDTFKLKNLTEENDTGKSKKVTAQSVKYDKNGYPVMKSGGSFLEYIKNKLGLSNEEEADEDDNEKEDDSTQDVDDVKDSDFGVIYLGDSRTVGMKDTITAKNNEYFVCEVGKGYDWMVSTGISQVNSIMSRNSQYKKWKIVTNLGINDIDNTDKYISKYKELMSGDWKNCDLIFESINPVDSDKMVSNGYTKIENETIDAFNSKIKSNVPGIGYIDTNKSISSFSTTDGLHYDGTTYKAIYNKLCSSLDNSETIEGSTSNFGTKNSFLRLDKDDYETTEGVWDYGFAPVLKYKEDKVDRVIRGHIVARDKWMGKERGVEEIPLENPEPIEIELEGYPQKIYLIDKVVSFVGNFEYQYVPSETFIKTLSVGEGEKNQDVTKVKYATHKEEEHDEDGNVTSSTTYDLYEYREGSIIEIKPKEAGVNSDLVGDRYYSDYIYNYKAYPPQSVMKDFDFKDRTGEDWEKVALQYSGTNIDYSGNFATDGLSADGQAIMQKIAIYMPKIDEVCEEMGIDDPYIIYALIAQESGGNPDINGDGLMQVTGSNERCALNAQGVKVCQSLSNKTNTDVNIRAGIIEFKNALDDPNANGDYLKALFAYNMGTGTLAYIANNYPESMNSSDWLKYREEARQHSASAEGYHNSCSASDSNCSGPVWGDTLYIEHVMRYYCGTGQYANNLGVSNQTGMGGGSISSLISKLWGNFKNGWLDFFHLGYKEDEPRIRVKNGVTPVEAEQIIKSALSMTDKTLYTSTDPIDADFWKNAYEKLFLSRKKFGSQGQGSTISEMNGMKSPLDMKDPTIVTKFGTNNGVSSTGVDISVPEGTTIKACGSGEVIKAENGIVEIAHANGTKSVYKGLKDITVSKKDKVETGDKLGEVDSGGMFHFEFYVNDLPVDPTPIIKGQTGVDLDSLPDGDAKKVIEEACKYLGVPYVYGGATPSGFDCSGLTQWAYSKGLGIEIGRDTGAQYTNGASVELEDIQPGDLILYRWEDTNGGRPKHVTMYIGDGKMIHAPHSGDVVKISPLQTTEITGIRRYIK